MVSSSSFAAQDTIRLAVEACGTLIALEAGTKTARVAGVQPAHTHVQYRNGLQ